MSDCCSAGLTSDRLGECRCPAAGMFPGASHDIRGIFCIGQPPLTCPKMPETLMARQEDRPGASRSPLMTSAESPSRSNLVLLSKTIMEGLLFLAQPFIYKSHPAYSSWFHYPLDVYRAPFLNICAIILLGIRVRLSRQ